MNFNDAYKEMLNGKCVRRKGWAWWDYSDDYIATKYWFIDNYKIKIRLDNGKLLTKLTPRNLADAAKTDWEVVSFENIQLWRPKKNEKYWYIDDKFQVNKAYNKYVLSQNDRIKAGNCFKTPFEAIHAAKKLEVIKQLQDFASEAGEVNLKDDNQSKYYLTYCTNTHSIEILNCYTHYFALPFNIYFTSIEAAKKAIEFVGEEKIKMYYFDIDEENNK